MAGQPRHLHCLLSFLDPLLRLAALVVELDDLPVPELRVTDPALNSATNCDLISSNKYGEN
jgi:hypothetical protein